MLPHFIEERTLRKFNMHIIFISTWYPTSDNTSGTFVEEQAEALALYGHKVSVMMFQYFTFRGAKKRKAENGKLSDWRQNKLHHVFSYDFIDFIPKSFFRNPLKAQLNAYLKYVNRTFQNYIQKEGKPEILHQHGAADRLYITKFLSEKFNIPYVVTLHSPFDKKAHIFNPYETEKSRNEVIRNASSRIAVSSFYNKRYEEIFKAEFITVPNVISKLFEQTPLPPVSKKDTYTYIAIGALIDLKGHERLISAFSEIEKSAPNIRLKIVGEGTNRPKLEKQISDLKLNDKIELTGLKSRIEVLKLIDDSDCLVVSSTMETFAVVAIEAMFRGKPVISTKCGGPEDIVTNENGILVENDTNGLISGIRTMTFEKKFDKEKIIESVSNRFSTTSFCNQITNLYSDIINHKKM